METIGNRLEKFREKIEMGQVDFSHKLGVTQASISAIERGKSEPGSKLLKSLLQEFPSFNIAWLLTGEGGMFNGDFVEQKVPVIAKNEYKMEKEPTFMERMLADQVTELNKQISALTQLLANSQKQLLKC